MYQLSYSEITAEINKIPDGKSLVFQDGKVYLINSGKIKRDGKEPIIGIYAGKKSLNIDGNGKNEGFNTSSWVNSPSRAFKNYWDSGALKLPEKASGLDHLFLTLLIEASTEETLLYNTAPVNLRGIEYNSIEIKDTRIVLYFSANSKYIRFYRIYQDSTYRTYEEVWL